MVAIIAAAFFHAIWNFILKDSDDKAVCIVIIYLTSLPFAIIGMSLNGLPSSESIPVIIFSAILQAVYSILLFKGYEVGSLSSVYPIARGSAPVFVFIYTIAFLDVQLTLMAIAGISIICSGLAYYAVSSSQVAGAKSQEIVLATAIGFFIASYSITDAFGTRMVGNALSFFGAMAIANRGFLIIYLYSFEKDITQRIISEFSIRFVFAGLFAFACYAVVLWAYTEIPIPVVATLRESSILFATLIGFFVLRESLSFAKIFMIGAVVMGLLLLLGF